MPPVIGTAVRRSRNLRATVFMLSTLPKVIDTVLSVPSVKFEAKRRATDAEDEAWIGRSSA